MNCAGTNAFLLEVGTAELTRGLKYLLKCEPQGRSLRLTFDSETLTVSIGKTSRDVTASGTWLQSVSVARSWAEGLTTTPIESAITVLRLAEGKLWGRDFGATYWLGPPEEDADEIAKREENIDESCKILAAYGVTRPDVVSLVEKGDSAKALLWGAGDGQLIDDVAHAWTQLAEYGVEPSDIRHLFDRKSRQLWKSGPKRDRDGYSPFARYHVSEAEKRALGESGDPAKASLWKSRSYQMVHEVAKAWRYLVTYGTEAFDILLLIDSKSR